jgi:exopolyphosphatase/guanosine-5'-triphosphate,3'-diphosphate pyrophosphatase
VGWPGGAARRLVAIGGTARNLATAAQRAAGISVGGVQGATVDRGALAEIIARLAALPPCERTAVPGIKPARADVVLAGAIVLDSVLEAGGFDQLEVTEEGLREGIFFERLLAGHDPPLLQDVRRSSVLNLAGRYEVASKHTEHVAALALGMFDALARLGLHKGSARERELLWAASVLHDIGMSVDYDDHHKHSQYLILNAGLPGFTPRELAIIAQATRYHRKGMPEPGPLAPLLTKGDLERLDRCAVLLRLAEDLERSRDQAVRATELSMRNGTVSLHLIAQGETCVPRWAAGRECSLFHRAFGRELAIA